MATHVEWVIEGCYGDLIEAAAARCTELRFLNPGADVCIAKRTNGPGSLGTANRRRSSSVFSVRLSGSSASTST